MDKFGSVHFNFSGLQIIIDVFSFAIDELWFLIFYVNEIMQKVWVITELLSFTWYSPVVAPVPPSSLPLLACALCVANLTCFSVGQLMAFVLLEFGSLYLKYILQMKFSGC